MKLNLSQIKYIAFDADDTLWENEIFFRSTEQAYYKLLEKYGTPKTLEKHLFEIEIGHLTDYGFGVKSFTLSMLETALKVSDKAVSGELIDKILDLGKLLLNHPVELIGAPEKVLIYLKDKAYRLMLLTKGDLMDQQRKLTESGLRKYFDLVEVMTDKTEPDYIEVFQKHKIDPKEVLMIGNSLKSDVLPLTRIGGQAIYVPHDTTWIHEHVSEDMLDTKTYTEIKSLNDIVVHQLL